MGREMLQTIASTFYSLAGQHEVNPLVQPPLSNTSVSFFKVSLKGRVQIFKGSIYARTVRSLYLYLQRHFHLKGSRLSNFSPNLFPNEHLHQDNQSHPNVKKQTKGLFPSPADYLSHLIRSTYFFEGATSYSHF
jgi:hypothetical protein